MPENTIYVGRPTKWGNPFRAVRREEGGRVEFVVVDRDGKQRGPGYAQHRSAAERAVELFEQFAKAKLLAEVGELRGKNLACWCGRGRACHADVLLELANQVG